MKQKRITRPRGPQGQKRPADVIGNPVNVMRVARGEEEYEDDGKEPSREGALGGVCGKARAKRLMPERRAETTWKAAQ